MSRQDLGWNASRVLFGLSRIGYTPQSAIADIVDNSITNGAKNVFVHIVKDRSELSDNRKNNIKEYLIIDDGRGMDKEGILAALELGNNDFIYNDDSLSKFGLGLKSASFSQGNILEIMSSNDNEFLKYKVDLKTIRDSYYCTEEDLTDEDNELIDKNIEGDNGTIIRITDIHQNNHPSPKDTISELQYRLGIIYFYFIDDGIKLTLNDEVIEKYDVLFTEEADQNGNLNEYEWSGKEVCWIKKLTSQTLDIDSEPAVCANVEVTQLPHPPIHSLDGESEQAKIRKKYKIEAGNYGFYVYRNKRLISWAERFNGLIPQDQDYFSFRGRILLDSTADDAFNIDVKKSHITLSGEARNSLSDLSDEYKRKSKKAWQRAGELKSQMLGAEPNQIANNIAEGLDIPDMLPGEPILSPEEEKEKLNREKEIKKKIKQKIRSEATEQEEKGELTDDEVSSYVSENNESKDKRIIRAKYIQDNHLWEPYYDDDHGWSVRINKNHRFSKCIYEDNSDNFDLQVIYELFLLQMSHAEVSLRRQPDMNQDEMEKIISAYREAISGLLVTMMRSEDIELPPLN
jgi:hypothetical protein